MRTYAFLFWKLQIAIMNENDNLKSQFATLSWGGKRKLPFAFTEQVYHCGASSKDAGKKLFAINKISDFKIIYSVIDALLLEQDKKI